MPSDDILVGPDKLQTAAELQLRRIEEAVKASLKWPKRFLALLAATCVLLLGATGFTSYLYVNQASVTATAQAAAQAAKVEAQVVRRDAIQACEDRNRRILASTANWDFFVDLALRGDTKPKDIAAGNALKAHVARTNVPQDCVKEFSS